jgi:acetoin utilization protein AcuC
MGESNVERKSIFIFDEALNKGGYPDGCPFDSGRPGRTAEIISSLGLLHLPGASQIPPIPLTREQMLTFHTADYLKVLDRAGRGIHDFKTLRSGLGTPDCPMFEEMLQFLALAAGGSTTGAGLILSGEANIVFNPSGGFHHAGPDTASGFCYINDIVLAAKMLAREKKRVMVLDLDAHHGDGVQNAFWDRSDVVTVSMHEDGRTLFPGTGAVDEIGEGDGLGCSVNIPLPVGTYDAVYYRAFTEVVLPLVEAVAPDVLILCLGMDGLAGDPLAHLNLTNNVYADIIADLVELDIPILATGGGGYHPENTARGWALAWSIFAVGRDEGIAGFGMGGVMLENTAWFGGLRDRTLLSHGGYRESVEKEVLDTVAAIQTQIFALHGLPG